MKKVLTPNIYSGYIAEEKLAIAKKYLSPLSESSNGVTGEQLVITDEAMMSLIRSYCR